MNNPADVVEIDPAVFLTRACQRLTAAPGTDAEIAAIVTNMLTGDAAVSAGVIPAREALRRLAQARALDFNVGAIEA